MVLRLTISYGHTEKVKCERQEKTCQRCNILVTTIRNCTTTSESRLVLKARVKTRLKTRILHSL